MWFGSFPKLEPNWGNLNGNSIVVAGGLEQICLGIPKGAHSSLSKESGVWQGVLYDVDCARSNLENNNTFGIFTMIESVYILVGVLSSILKDTCGWNIWLSSKALGTSRFRQKAKVLQHSVHFLNGWRKTSSGMFWPVKNRCNNLFSCFASSTDCSVWRAWQASSVVVISLV